MAARKKTMYSSPEGQKAMLDNVSAKHLPKMTLTDREQTFFDMIVTSREAGSWSDNDLFIASQLAKSYRRLEELGDILDEQGYVQVNERGTQISNPIFAAMSQLQNAINAANRTLGLSASQRALTGEKQSIRNEADARAREVIDSIKDDSLLA
jgi:P27 family predicted phage terminase small subunit